MPSISDYLLAGAAAIGWSWGAKFCMQRLGANPNVEIIPSSPASPGHPEKLGATAVDLAIANSNPVTARTILTTRDRATDRFIATDDTVARSNKLLDELGLGINKRIMQNMLDNVDYQRDGNIADKLLSGKFSSLVREVNRVFRATDGPANPQPSQQPQRPVDAPTPSPQATAQRRQYRAQAAAVRENVDQLKRGEGPYAGSSAPSQVAQPSFWSRILGRNPRGRVDGEHPKITPQKHGKPRMDRGRGND